MAKKTIKGLNGIRVLGLIGVLLYHMFPSLLPGGFLGVMIFFVLSGFLSAYSINNEIKIGQFNLIAYYLKRIRRIYLPLIIVLLWTVGILLKLAPLKLVNTQSEFLSIIFNYNNYWQIAKNADYFANLSSNSPFTHLWYISILMQFEILCPFVCIIYRKLMGDLNCKQPIYILIICTVLLGMIMPFKSFIPNVNTTALYYQSECRMFALFLGLCIGLIYSDFYDTFINYSKNKILAYSCFGLYLILTIVGFFHVKGFDINTYRYYLNGYAFLTAFILIFICNEENELWKILDFNVTNFLSKYSFEIYLWQYPILFFSIIIGKNCTIIDYVIQFVVIFILSIWLGLFTKKITNITKEKKIC